MAMLPPPSPPASTVRDPRGRDARQPWQIPLAGWRDVVLRWLFWRLSPTLSVTAAGVAFFGTLALFPGLVVVAAVYGLLFDVGDVINQLEALSGVAPQVVVEALSQRLRDLAVQDGGVLGTGLVLGLLAGLWGASRGGRGIIEGLNLAYGEVERRTPFSKVGLGVLLTVAGTGIVLLSLIAVAAGPAVAGMVGLERVVALLPLRWLVLTVSLFSAIILLFRLGPCRRAARWTWLMPGAAFATAGWMAASWGFSAWVSRFGDFDATYGTLGTFAVLMLWLYVGSQVILAAAALNCELERQTCQDTSIGGEDPQGSRAAWAADSVGPRPAGLVALILGREPQALLDDGSGPAESVSPSRKAPVGLRDATGATAKPRDKRPRKRDRHRAEREPRR